MDDPFAFMEGFQISSSQEDILRNCPLVQPVNSPGDGVPETAEDAGDILINLPKEQPYLRPCTCNKGVQTDEENVIQGFDGAMFVDLGDDSDFRFSLDERTVVAASSRGNCGFSEIENSIQISARELSSVDSLGEPPHKRMKNSERNPVFKPTSGTEPPKIGDNLQNCEGRLVSNRESPCKLGPQEIIQIGEEMPLGVEKNGSKEVNEVAESSEKIASDVLQKLRRIAERVKDMTKGKNDDEKAASFVFDVLKALTEEEEEEEASEKEDNLKNVSFLELARSRGFKFPTPRWWKEDSDT